MKGKILLLTGLAVGYVLGTRAGRERYEELKASANKVWSDPRVQKPVKQAEDFVKDKAPEVAEFVSDGVKKVVSQVSSKPKTAAKKPAARTTTTTASKPSTTAK
jgi:hypothetical protein